MVKEIRQKFDFNGAYSRLRRSLARYASRYFRRHQDIEDVVQEAFLKVLEAEQQRNIQVTDAYIYRTVHNLALKTIDKRDYKFTDTVGDDVPQSVLLETPSLEDQYESQERFGQFCRAVRQLPVKCQRVFILRRIYGLSPDEIAERMGISVKTVEAHLTKAIVRCTDYMKEQEMDSALKAKARKAGQGKG